MSICHLVSSICPARHLCWFMRKKGAGLTLTSLVTLRHNQFVRECVHGEEFSRSRGRLGELLSFVLQREATRPMIAAALMPFGACSGRGWLFSFVFQKTRIG